MLNSCLASNSVKWRQDMGINKTEKAFSLQGCVDLLWFISIYLLASTYFDLHQFTLLCINLLYFASIYFDLHQFTLICINWLWFASIYFDFHLFTLIFINLLWFSSIYFHLHRFNLICINLLWFASIYTILGYRQKKRKKQKWKD